MTTQLAQPKTTFDTASKLKTFSIAEFRTILTHQQLLVDEATIKQVYDTKQNFSLKTALGIIEAQVAQIKREENAMVFDCQFLGDRDSRNGKGTEGTFVIIEPGNAKDEMGEPFEVGDLVEIYMKEGSINVKGQSERIRLNLNEHVKLSAFWNEWKTKNDEKAYTLMATGITERELGETNVSDFIKLSDPTKVTQDDLYRPLAFQGKITWIEKAPIFEDGKKAGDSDFVYTVNDKIKLAIKFSISTGSENYRLQTVAMQNQYAECNFDHPDGIEELLKEGEEVLKAAFSSSEVLIVGKLSRIESVDSDRKIITYLNHDLSYLKLVPNVIDIQTKLTDHEPQISGIGMIQSHDGSMVHFLSDASVAAAFKAIVHSLPEDGTPIAVTQIMMSMMNGPEEQFINEIQDCLNYGVEVGTILQTKPGYYARAQKKEEVKSPYIDFKKLADEPQVLTDQTIKTQPPKTTGSKADLLLAHLAFILEIVGPDADVDAVRSSGLLEDEFSDYSDDIMSRALDKARKTLK